MLTLVCLTFFLSQEKVYEPKLDGEKLPIPFQRYTTVDGLGRTITFYLSRSKGEKALPLILFIGGSGCQSLFQKYGENIGGGMQNLLLKEVGAKARVVCVEKPGVKFLDAGSPPGTANQASEEYLKQHTLPSWGEANLAALQACWKLEGIDMSKTLVLGHSEGALTASFVASKLPEVTHVAPLAAAGPTQLYSLMELAATARPSDKPGDATKRRDKVLANWHQILKDPDSTSKFWMGHPYRRWHSFLQYNSIDLLKASKAKIYLAHGSEDKASYIGELDVLRAELAVQGRDFIAERIEGADHSYRMKDEPPSEIQGLSTLLNRIVTWFLK